MVITRKRKGDAEIIHEETAFVKHNHDFDVVTGDKQIVTKLPTAEVIANILNGDQLLDLAAAEPTLDRYLDRSPKLNTDQDYEQMVLILQRKRAAFITAEQKKREPKIEGEDNGEIQD